MDERTTGRSREGEGRGAVLVPVGIMLLGVIELALLIWFGSATSLWWALLVVLIGWIVGVALLVAAGQQSFVRLRSLIRALRGSGDVKDHLSRPAFTLLAAACFFFPGFLTDLIGLVLLLTPVQKRTVRAMGLGGGDAGRRVLYSRSRGGVIDAEVVVQAQRTDAPAADGGRVDGSHRIPPVIVQDDTGSAGGSGSTAR